MKIVVTGGAGFVGANLIKYLNRQGEKEIIIIDDYEEKKLNNLIDAEFSNYFDYTRGPEKTEDFLNRNTDIKVFFHIGANTNVLDHDAQRMMYQNFEFSRLYFEFCSRHEIPFIYASTSAIYGNSENFSIKPENEAPCNMYAWSKWLFDKYTKPRMTTAKNKVIGLRLFNVFGLGEFHKGENACVANRFVDFMHKKEFIDLFSGSIKRDYVWVEDLAAIFYQSYLKTDLKNGIYNVGGGDPIAHKEIAEMVVKNFLDKGLITGQVQDYIHEIPLPEPLKGHFQFLTCAAELRPFISEITRDNRGKMNQYIQQLISLGWA